LPKQMSFMQLAGDNLQLTAFKRAEDRPASYVVRLFNPTDMPVSGELRLFKPVKQAWLTNLNEEREKVLKPAANSIPVEVGKKKIVTVEFLF
ncbi:MAG: glycosyl hydrolase-related protein, partial [Candidatus Hydrogenedentes bacterium]|nr:glycosyl hydrolase-related protein [Candidatus Hydrogenedentota bacterium]